MAFIGIDVGKEKLDVLWLRQSVPQKVKTRVFRNHRPQLQDVAQWLIKQTGKVPGEIHVVMEATSIYHENLAYALHGVGFRVYVANPARVKEFARSEGVLNKTDKKDSLVLALYAQEKHTRLTAWQPEAKEIRQLRSLMARLEALEKDLQREKNRHEKALATDTSERVMASIEDMIAALEAEIRKLKDDIDNHINGHPRLKDDRELLKSIPGVAEVCSVQLLALLRSRDFVSARECAAFIGVVPVQVESGSSIRRQARISKAGRSAIRQKLYMAAVTACQHNPDISALKRRMQAKGKAGMTIVVAAMRKLVHIAYGVLKHQQGYIPQAA
ncbi:MAG: IS110 family transposase [Gammaproteobacteria bacterium HGW-Gammaproteobacteria-11]|nr:MAG: IS110 family transposase [Gammaproteobacteria bacterium HGW-Gammaproteobacteria-11]